MEATEFSPPPICPVASEQNAHILVGVTGSVAALKLPLLVAELLKIPGLEVLVVTTENAKHFYKLEEIPVRIYGDSDEWQLWKKRTDPVLHIDLRRWADLMLVAPLDANTLAKIANGICDNLLTCIVRAWDVTKPLLFCPAMNTLMWEHPVTARQVGQLKEFGYTEIPCIVKKLVCGDEGGCASPPSNLRAAMAKLWHADHRGQTEASLLAREPSRPSIAPELSMLRKRVAAPDDDITGPCTCSESRGAMADVSTIVEKTGAVLLERGLLKAS